MSALLLALLVTSPEPVRIGSKVFTESVLLGEITRQTLVTEGLEAEHRRELGGTAIAWQALVGGSIDVYPEYVGTLIHEILGKEGVRGEAQLVEALERHGVYIAAELGFEDGYAIGVRPEIPIRRISELRDAPGIRMAFSSEFIDRRDGWPGLARAYGFSFGSVRGLQHTLAYEAIQEGQLDLTDVYTTDPEIDRLGLRVLEDDKHYFPSYRAVLLARRSLAPEAQDALAKLAGAIEVKRMRVMNARAAVEHVPESTVAAEFVEATFNVMLAREARSNVWTRFVTNLAAHLGLVAVSLLAAIMVGVPIGVLAAKSRRVGSAMVGLTGVVQTVPSLALLVFMIPLFGIGYLPAVMALFVYSLLPIVQNTYVGVHDMPLPLRESAIALGLGPATRIFRIDVPLAAPSIVAGIRTSAVINVGTATLGALIGAGGFGQPILTGIRLNNVGLVLEGAIPAALLALVVQAALTVAERWFVPKGLRLVGDAGT